MKSLLKAAAIGLAAACLASAARAAVTLNEMDVALDPSKPTVTTPSWVFQNDYLQVVVVKASGKVPAIIKRTGIASNTNQAVTGYPAFLDWAQQKGITVSSLVLAANPDGDDSDAKRSLKITATIDTTLGTKFNLTKIYRLRDASKSLETENTFANTNLTTDWAPADPYNGVCEVVYTLPGGSGTTGDQMQVKTSAGIEVPTATTWYGWAASGTTPRPELIEGWLASVDQGNSASITVTWDMASARAHSPSGVSATRAGVFGSRFQVNPSFTKVAAGETLTYKQYAIIDDGIKTISYAAPESFIGGIVLSGTAFSQGSTVGVQYLLNSTKATDTASYDLKNVKLVNSDGATVKTLPDMLANSLPANQHLALSKQFSLASDIDVTKTYIVTADVFPAGGATAITTLVSKGFLVTAANVKVALYLDPGTGLYVLENENLKVTLTPGQGYGNELYIKSVNRNQAASGYQMFRDAITNPARLTFTGFSVVLDPNGTDSPTKKSIQFLAGYNALANLTKTFTLESMSKSLQVDLSVQNFAADPITGWGFYCDVPSQVGGSGGAEDQFTAHVPAGLQFNFPVPVDPGYTRYWFGCIPQADNTALIAGAQAELDQSWMAASDTTNGDALATSWDKPTQLANSSIPTDGTVPVTMNCIFRGGENAVGEGRRHVMETHFDNIAVGATVNYTLYTIADTGMNTVSYAEGKRVMAGLWNNAGDVAQGTNLGFTLSVTNVGTTARSFDVKSIRIVKDTGETAPAAADQTGLAASAGANSTALLTFAVPVAQAVGAYHLEGDLYEGATRVTTLQSLPFNITAGAIAPTGDVNGDGKVDAADVALALSVAGGLTTATPDNVAKGDIWPATPDKAITAEDAVAIARKVAGL